MLPIHYATSNAMRMNSRKQVLLLFRLGYLVLLTTICPKSCLGDGNHRSRLLQGSDFKLESRVRVVAPGSTQIDEEVTLTEYYSISERRARLEFHSIHRASGSTNVNLRGLVYFYRRRSSGEYLRLNAIPMIYSSRCQLVEPLTLTQDLFGKASSLDGHNIHQQWLDDRPDVPDYMIGLARLMVIVENNRDKLVPANRPDVLIRNQKAKKYTLKDRLMSKSDDKLTELIIYYANSDEHQSGSDLPLRIWLITPDFAEIIVDYSFGGPIWPRPNDPINESSNFFSFPPGFGCSGQLQKAINPDLKQAPDVFSFRFEKESPSDDIPTTSYFVAYDGFARAFRLDQVNTGERLQKGDYSITIADIKRNRGFNIRQPVREMFGEQPEIDSSSNNNQCAASMLVPADSQDLIHDLALPFDQMVEMGIERVRGVDTRVFEQVTNELPALFFPKMWYRNTNTFKYEYVDDFNSSKTKWVIVYYFTSKTIGTSSRDVQFGQLMRVDVISVKLVVFRFEVYDFVWSLQMAPNGDSQDELFALRDRCSQVVTSKGLTQDRYANLEMDMVYDTNKVGHVMTMNMAAELIRSEPTRRQELTRALVMSDSLGATHLYDLETKMKPIDEDKLLVKLEAKLLDSKQQPLFEAALFGYGYVVRSQEITRATNADECFWEAVHRMRLISRPVLFSFCFQVCTLDSNSELQTNPETHALEAVNSSVFKITPGRPDEVCHPCDIMRIDQLKPEDYLTKEAKSELEKTKRPLWKSTFFSLNRRQLFLPLANQNVKKDTILPLQVTRIELSNSKWSEDTGGQVQHARPDWDNADTLTGLSLSHGSWCDQVMPPPLKLPTSLKDLEDLEDADVAPMSFELCQANCIADMSCRSFSICTVESSPELICLKSKLEFRQPELLERIDSLANPLKQANKKGTIQVDMTPTGDPWGLESSEDKGLTKQVALRVDKRCRLYNKSALEMFKFLRTSPSLKAKYSNLMGVDSEEQCAERCLRINLNFFKRTAKIRVKSLLNQNNLQRDEQLRELLAAQAINLRTWCSGFNYINLATASLSEELESGLGSTKTKKNGLCRVRRGSVVAINNQQQTTQPTSQPEEQTRKLEVKSDKYELIYSNLYERRPGFRMRNRWPTDMDDEHKQLSLDQLVELIPNHNKQIVLKKNSVEDCARACFLQTSGMVPPCKSFGIYREPTKRNDEKPTSHELDVYCILNSMTLDEAKNSDQPDELIFEIANVPEHVMLHYEPKSAYNMDNLVMVGLLVREKNSFVGRIRYFQIGPVGLFILLAISLATGLWLGLSQGKRYLDKVEGRRESVSCPSRSFLTSLVGSSDVTHQRFEPEIDLPDIKEI